jgi:hypothetical protein
LVFIAEFSAAAGYINEGYGGKAGYYFSSTCVLIGSAALSLIDVHRRRVAKHKHIAANGKQHTCIIENCPDRSLWKFSSKSIYLHFP